MVVVVVDDGVGLDVFAPDEAVGLGVFVADAADDSFSSSSTSLAWSASSVDSSDDTVSLSAVVWSVPKD